MSSECSGSCSSSQSSKVADVSSVKRDTLTHVSEYSVPKMDCMAEESMIRMALADLQPAVVATCDLSQRRVQVFHADNESAVTERIESTGLGGKLISSAEANPSDIDSVIDSSSSADQETRILKWLLGINAVMFLVEFAVGWHAQSTGLLADSLDMFADAAVYGIALYAVGRANSIKLRAAHLSGWLQLALVIGALSEVVRRFLYGSEPVSTLMMGMGFVALIANVWCLLLVSKNRHGGAHMKASWIFSANDVIANIGVILAGGLVAWSGSHYPDLIIGLIIALIVLSGAIRILRIKS